MSTRPPFGALGLLEHRAAWIAAGLALLASLATMTSDPIGVFNDDGIYLLTAKAIAEGLGYVYPQLPGHPPAIHYPPGWPALLAVVWKLGPAFPGNIGWLKLINPLITAAGAAAAVVAGRRLFGLPWWAALITALIAAISVPVLLLTNLLLSEPLFLLLLFPTLLTTQRLVRDGGVRTAAVAAVLAASLVLVRTLGGTIVIAAVLLLGPARRWRELLVYLAVTVALLLPWQWYVWQASAGFPDELRGSYGPYLEWVVDGYRAGGVEFFGQVLAKNLEATWAMLGVFFSPFVGGAMRHLFAAAALVTFLGGLVSLWVTGRSRLTALALAGYLAVVLAWPFWVDRFLWVIWPLLALSAAHGLHAAWEATRVRGGIGRRGAVAPLILAAALGLQHLAYNARGLAEGWESRASADMTAAADLLIRQVNGDPRLDGKRIAAELAPMVALYSGLEVVPLEILRPVDHVIAKDLETHTAELEAIDRRFRPDAYIVMQAGPFYGALAAARLETGRTLVDVSPRGTPVRTILVQP